jgi:DNA-binding MarR family transcriptional regulator
MSNISSEAIFLHQAIADTLGLNITDHKCVSLISRFGPMTAGKLAELSGLTTGAITGVIDRLEKIGYAERIPNPEDRRVIFVELTQGNEVEKKMRSIFSRMSKKMEKIFANFTDEELAFILKYLTMTVNASHQVTLDLKGKNEK